MSENFPRASLPIVLLASLIAGCSGASDRVPASPPEPREGTTVSRWKKIYTIEIVGGENRRVHRGYLERRFSPITEEDKVYVVYDADRKARGFVLPSGKVYAYGRDVSGDMTTREVGHEELDDAVLKLLGARGAIEYTGIEEGGKTPDSPTGTEESSPPARR